MGKLKALGVLLMALALTTATAAAQPEPQPLAYERTVTGTFTDTAPMHVWALAGSVGDVITVTVSTDGFVPFVLLHVLEDTPIAISGSTFLEAESAGMAADEVYINTFALPLTETYLLYVGAVDALGTYSVAVKFVENRPYAVPDVSGSWAGTQIGEGDSVPSVIRFELEQDGARITGYTVAEFANGGGASADAVGVILEDGTLFLNETGITDSLEDPSTICLTYAILQLEDETLTGTGTALPCGSLNMELFRDATGSASAAGHAAIP